MSFKIFGITTLLSLAFSISYAQSNSGFENGLFVWQTSGKVTIDKSNAHSGSQCAVISSGSVFQRMPVAPLAIVQFDIYFKSVHKGGKAYSFLRFYNKKHRLLIDYSNKSVDTTNYIKTGNYTEAPPEASYMEIGVAKESGSGVVYVDDLKVDADVDRHKNDHQPLVNIDQYMRPFWKSDTIYNETVLLYSKNGGIASGELLYQPDHILSVKSFDLKTTFNRGKDYAIEGNVIERLAGSTVPFRADTSFDTKNDLAWFNTQSQWVVVTCTHHDKWIGPVPAYKGNLLPLTIEKLRTKKALRIVAFGMSITRGLNISSYDTVPPYMPTYVSLFARQLREAYHDPSIKLYNAGLPGSAVDWGAQYADKYVNPLKPDLVILDFGMNDFWRLTPEQFEGYMETIINKVKTANPRVEIILISNMKFDPEYVLSSDKYKSFYEGNIEGYSHVLKQMETKGIINLDMYSLSAFIYDHKKAKDCISNPLHPNDYLARWFAQGLSALLIK